jgi:hypothetical protein
MTYYLETMRHRSMREGNRYHHSRVNSEVQSNPAHWPDNNHLTRLTRAMGVKRKPTFDNEATERRRRIAFALLDTLTKTGSALQTDDVPHFRQVAGWYGGKELVDRILAASQQKKSSKNKGISANFNQLQEEILLAIAITCLERLLA